MVPSIALPTSSFDHHPGPHTPQTKSFHGNQYVELSTHFKTIFKKPVQTIISAFPVLSQVNTFYFGRVFLFIVIKMKLTYLLTGLTMAFTASALPPPEVTPPAPSFSEHAPYTPPRTIWARGLAINQRKSIHPLPRNVLCCPRMRNTTATYTKCFCSYDGLQRSKTSTPTARRTTQCSAYTRTS